MHAKESYAILKEKEMQNFYETTSDNVYVRTETEDKR